MPFAKLIIADADSDQDNLLIGDRKITASNEIIDALSHQPRKNLGGDPSMIKNDENKNKNGKKLDKIAEIRRSQRLNSNLLQNKIDTTTSHVPEGGRWWKKRAKQRNSANLYKNKAQKLSFEKRMQKKKNMQQLQQLDRQLKEEARLERKEKWRKIEQKRIDKAANELKSQSVQRITNTAKLKKMSRKQLRQLAKAA